MGTEFLSSMVKQQVKKMTGCKTKEADVHKVDSASKGLGVLLMLMQT